MTTANYTRAEEERVAAALREGQVPVCPRCGTPFALESVPPREGLPYVRNRLWLTCDGCRRSLVLDRRRVETRR